MADLDNLPGILGLTDAGPSLRQVEQVRKRLVSYYGGTGQNPTDRAALGRVIDAFDQRVEDLMSVGMFGQRAPATASSPLATVADDVPFPGLGEGFGPAASGSLPIGDVAPAEAMRRARGLFREYKQAFAPRGPGDVAGQRLQRIVERDASPSDVVTSLFGTTTGRISSGQLQTLTRLRSAVGEDSEPWQAVQQSIIARYVGGDGRDMAGRLDYLLRSEGRAVLPFLSAEQRAGLGRLRGAVAQTEAAQAAAPASPNQASTIVMRITEDIGSNPHPAPTSNRQE
ncbi:hypothetical protein [Methylobacterium oryzisoli]|uniref:hypothetical protein n=1 Tax=Methylobacterium oryzisoli TaxID=3385502 RepID=UPI00389213F1